MEPIRYIVVFDDTYLGPRNTRISYRSLWAWITLK